MVKLKIESLGKEADIHEVKYLDLVAVESLKTTDTREALKKLILLATNLIDDDVEKLPAYDGIELQKKINEVNRLGDFRSPTKEENQS